MNQMFMKQKIYILLLTLVCFSSCKISGPAHQSRLEGKAYELKYPIYDASSKIRFAVSNDDSLLYVRAEVKERASQMKVSRLGFSVYFDSAVKKGKDIGVTFPIKTDLGKIKADPKDKSMVKPNFKVPDEFIWNDYNGAKRYNLNSTALPVALELTHTKDGVLEYEAEIPLKLIFPNEFPSDSIFSIGFVSGALDMSMMPQRGGGMQGQGMGGRGQGMQGMGGQGRGSMGGGPPGGGMRGGQGGRGDKAKMMQELMTPISFWVKVKLQ